MQDEFFMREALRIASNAKGRTSPNPMVGAVVVKNGRIVAEGWHRKAGTPHAEIHALKMAGDLAKGATVYVTLEPCSHYGRTGPCAKALVEASVARVVVAMKDPNPKVAGNGIRILEEAGIEVKCGVLEAEAVKLNEVFLKWISTRRPFVAMKTAMSLDGKIATCTGESQWITNSSSRRRVHELRDIYDAILVGINTVLKDDPSLTTRLEAYDGRNPVRVVLDSSCRIPFDSKLVSDEKSPLIVAVTEEAPCDRVNALRAKGVRIISCGNGPRVDIDILLSELGRMNITSLFVEGGGQVNNAFLKAGAVDRVYAFIAPMLIGGQNALTPVEGDGFARLSDAVRLKEIETELLDDDIFVTGVVE